MKRSMGYKEKRWTHKRPLDQGTILPEPHQLSGNVETPSKLNANEFDDCVPQMKY